jgi:hypothetical protein
LGGGYVFFVKKLYCLILYKVDPFQNEQIMAKVICHDTYVNMVDPQWMVVEKQAIYYSHKTFKYELYTRTPK